MPQVFKIGKRERTVRTVLFFAVRKIGFVFLAEIQYYVSRIVCLERLVSYESTKIYF